MYYAPKPINVSHHPLRRLPLHEAVISLLIIENKSSILHHWPNFYEKG